MANAKFTRDEVILLLDVAHYSPPTGKCYSSTMPAVIELSQILQQLPIYPKEERPENFRNCPGIRNQLNNFNRGFSDQEGNTNVGGLFFQVDCEFPDKMFLHQIAESIRRNLPYFDANFGTASEDEGFPEGILLGHLHRIIERRDGAKLPKANRCAICHLEPATLYQPCENLLQHHLVIAPAQMDGSKKYTAEHFITVCPNCHAALHRCRPWLGKDNCGELLR